MLTLTLLLAFAVFAGLLAVIGWQRRPPMLHRRCLVNLVSDDAHAISAVFWERRGDWLVFRDAAAVHGEQRTPMDGDVVIHVRNVAFVQVQPHGSEQLRHSG